MTQNSATTPESTAYRAFLVKLIGSISQKFDSSVALRITVLVLVGFFVRASIFGEWNYDVDDQFYSLVGQRMLHGATLYVDIWDRKGPVLFLLYAAIAAVSPNPILFQLTATVFAIAGAAAVMEVARGIGAPARAALMAGTLYIGFLNQYGGASGQSPVFYNPLLIAAAASIGSRLESLKSGKIDFRICAGVACAGLAIGMKQSEAVVSIFFGFFILSTLLRSEASRWRVFTYAVTLSLIGGAPYLAAGIWYGIHGEFSAFWSAIVSSNFSRTYYPTSLRVFNITILIAQLSPLLLMAWIGRKRLSSYPNTGERLQFVVRWALAAIVGLLVYPNVFDHYALPLFPPLCILTAGFVGAPRIGSIAFAAQLALSLTIGGTLDFGTRLRSHSAHRQFTRYVASQVPHHRLLVFARSPLLYALTDSPPMSPLAFGHHLFDVTESGVSGLNEKREVARILMHHPDAIILDMDTKRRPTNLVNAQQVSNYVRHCRKQRRFMMFDRMGPTLKLVASECAQRRTTR